MVLDCLYYSHFSRHPFSTWLTWSTTYLLLYIPDLTALRRSVPTSTPKSLKKIHTGLRSSGIQILCEIHVRKEKSGPEIVPGGIIPPSSRRVGGCFGVCLRAS